MGFNSWIVARTGREGLLYGNLVALDLLLKRARNLPARIARGRRITRYLAANAVRKVQFGAGGSALPGFLDSDLLGRVPIDIRGRLPLPDGSIDLFYSNHLVEHIHQREFRVFLAETRRCLRPGGRHLFGTPSLERLALIVYGDARPQERADVIAHHERVIGHPLARAEFLNAIMHINYGHRFLYDLETVERMARAAGYASVSKLPDNRATGEPAIDAYLAAKDRSWEIETETFLLTV